MSKKVVRVDGDAEAMAREVAEAEELTFNDAVAKLIRIGYARRAALEKAKQKARNERAKAR